MTLDCASQGNAVEGCNPINSLTFFIVADAASVSVFTVPTLAASATKTGRSRMTCG